MDGAYISYILLRLFPYYSATALISIQKTISTELFPFERLHQEHTTLHDAFKCRYARHICIVNEDQPVWLNVLTNTFSIRPHTSPLYLQSVLFKKYNHYLLSLSLKIRQYRHYTNINACTRLTARVPKIQFSFTCVNFNSRET